MSSERKMIVTPIRKRKGVYEVCGVVFNADNEQEALRKYFRKPKGSK